MWRRRLLQGSKGIGWDVSWSSFRHVTGTGGLHWPEWMWRDALGLLLFGFEVTIRRRGGRDLSRTVEIHAAHYDTGSLTVEPKFVEPGPEELKRIEAEVQLKAKVFAASADKPLWIGSFRAPVTAAPTDSFGTRRMFNGKLASIHKGMDFAHGWVRRCGPATAAWWCLRGVSTMRATAW